MENTMEHRLANQDSGLVTILSSIIALFMAGASLAGILLRETVYPTAQLLTGLLTNDMVNLIVGLPVLVFSMLAARRGSLTGLLCWPGALLFVFYNYLIYSLTMPFSWMYPVFPVLTILSLAGFILLIRAIHGSNVKERLENKVAERWCGGLMIGLGALYFLRSAALLIGAWSSHSFQMSPETATQITDLVVMLIWIASGLQLWRHRTFGYKTGLAVLFQGVTLFIGLILFFLLQPWLAGVPLPMTDLAVILVMSLAAIVPFVLFLRGTARKNETNR